MKYFMFFCLFIPVSIFAQSGLTGTWTAQIPDREGNMMTLEVSMNDDGTYGVDIMGDGNIDISGTYTVKENTITIQDDEGNECTEKGVYTYEIVDQTLTMKKVEDGCSGRGGPEGMMVMTRK